MDLITTDGYPAYEEAILEAYGETVTPPRTGKPGRPTAPYKVAPQGLTYAVVEKTREKGRVVKIATRMVFGMIDAVTAALGTSSASRAVNTSFVERQNGTDRHRNARKARKTYRFSKDWRHHEAVTYLSMYIYNFCWPVRTLRIKDEHGCWQNRSPAMAAGLADHRMVDFRMADAPSCAMLTGHEARVETDENELPDLFLPDGVPVGELSDFRLENDADLEFASLVCLLEPLLAANLQINRSFAHLDMPYAIPAPRPLDPVSGMLGSRSCSKSEASAENLASWGKSSSRG